MFDIGFSEVLLIAIAALVAIGPKDMPQILFRFGRFARRIRIFVNGFRDQYAEIMHDVEVDHYRKQYGETMDKDPKKIEEKSDGS